MCQSEQQTKIASFSPSIRKLFVGFLMEDQEFNYTYRWKLVVNVVEFNLQGDIHEHTKTRFYNIRLE